MKKILPLLLVAALLLTFAACGDSEDRDDKDDKSSGASTDGSHIFRGNENPTTLGTVSDPLDPQSIYSNLEYIPQMFYGKYAMGGDWQMSSSQVSSYLESAGTMEVAEGATHMDPAVMGAIPYRIEAGPDNLDHALCFITSRHWARLSFYKEGGSLTTCMASYEIDGTTIRFTPALSWNYDKESQFISYQMSDLVWEYDFSFSGPNLTLSQGGKSVTMVSERYANKDYFFQFEGYRDLDSPTFDDMDHIQFHSGTTVSLNTTDSHQYYGEIASVTEDGLVTMSWLDQDGNKYTRQFVYFLCDFDGIVLVDKENTYRFNSEYHDRTTAGLKDMVSFEEQAQLENLTDEKAAEILEKKADLLVDLAKAYEDSGLAVTIDEATGEITLDSSVLFAVNSSDISDEGKAFLQQFITVYTSVVFSDKYEGFVSKIMVEGHTDTSGSYEMNLDLSQKRADSVKNYCLSAECGVDSAYTAALGEMLQAVGFSYTDPIYKTNGEVDMDASRRVAFRFLINLAG